MNPSAPWRARTIRGREVREVPHLPVAERRGQLLAAAWRVLASQGLAATTTRAICAEAGMPQGAFHYCFASRDELLREVATGLLPDEITAAVAVIDRTGSLADCLERALLAYWDLVEADLGAHQVLYEITTAALRDPDGRDLAEQQYARYLQGARQVLARIAEVRRIEWRRPVEVLARQVVTVLDGLTLHYAVDRDRDAARAALSAFAQDLAAVGKRRTARTRPPPGAPAGAAKPAERLRAGAAKPASSRRADHAAGAGARAVPVPRRRTDAAKGEARRGRH